MCGILGIVGRPRPAALDAIELLRHRGPDGEGRWCGERAALAMRRLAIIDLDTGGPLSPVGRRRRLPDGARCGVLGIVGRPRPEALDAIELLRHRGPDGEGRWSGERAALAMRRLAIIDLETGDQPVSNERGDVVA